MWWQAFVLNLFCICFANSSHKRKCTSNCLSAAFSHQCVKCCFYFQNVSKTQCVRNHHRSATGTWTKRRAWQSFLSTGKDQLCSLLLIFLILFFLSHFLLSYCSLVLNSNIHILFNNSSLSWRLELT